MSLLVRSAIGMLEAEQTETCESVVVIFREGDQIDIQPLIDN
jgi:hypothetical protein